MWLHAPERKCQEEGPPTLNQLSQQTQCAHMGCVAGTIIKHGAQVIRALSLGLHSLLHHDKIEHTLCFAKFVQQSPKCMLPHPPCDLKRGAGTPSVSWGLQFMDLVIIVHRGIALRGKTVYASNCSPRKTNRCTTIVTESIEAMQ